MSQSERPTENDVLYNHPDHDADYIAACETLVSGTDETGHIESAIWQHDDGTILLVSYRPGEKAKMEDGAFARGYEIHGTGDRLKFHPHGLDDERLSIDVAFSTAYDVRFHNPTTVSVSTTTGGWPDEVLEAAKRFTVTHDIVLE